MTTERMLEDLVGLLQGETNWVQGYFPLTCGVYVLQKGDIRFTVYRLSVSGNHHLSITGEGLVNGSFEGEPVKSLYDSLVEGYGKADTKLLKKEREEAALKLALSKLRGE